MNLKDDMKAPLRNQDTAKKRKMLAMHHKGAAPVGWPEALCPSTLHAEVGCSHFSAAAVGQSCLRTVKGQLYVGFYLASIRSFQLVLCAPSDSRGLRRVFVARHYVSMLRNGLPSIFVRSVRSSDCMFVCMYACIYLNANR